MPDSAQQEVQFSSVENFYNISCDMNTTGQKLQSEVS